MKGNKTTRIASLLLAAAFIILAFGCVHEEIVRDSVKEETTGHVPKIPAPAYGRTNFMGMAVINSLIEEKQGKNEAINDAIYQITRAAGAEVKSKAVIADQKVEGRMEVSVKGTVIGIRIDDIYWQEYSVREGFGQAEIKKIKYYVLVSVPDEELNRLKGIKRNNLESLLADATTAINEGKLDKARDILKTSTGLFPDKMEGWISLAEVQEKLGDWDGTYAAWEAVGKLPDNRKAREMALVAMPRVNDERVVGRITKAEATAQSKDYAKALEMLYDAAHMKPSARIFDRLKNRYFEFLSATANMKIADWLMKNSHENIAIANFSGGSEVEGISIRDRIFSETEKNGAIKAKIIYLTDMGISGLQNARYDGIPDRDRKEIDKSKSDAVIFGTVGQMVNLYVYNIHNNATEPLLAVNHVGAIPFYPSNIENWNRLPSKASTSKGLRVEIWSEKSQYTIGGEVTFYLRSNQDCFVTLLDLQTSGGLFVLFPNALQKDNFIHGGIIYTIPDSNAPFSINVSGPSGVEGVKAIASLKPISIGDFTGSRTFVAARTTDAQNDLCARINSMTDRLPPDDWDIAEWTFEITK